MERSLNDIGEQVHDIVNWSLSDVRRTARELQLEMDANPIPRQRTEADRLLGEVAFEMWARKHRDPQVDGAGTGV